MQTYANIDGQTVTHNALCVNGNEQAPVFSCLVGSCDYVHNDTTNIAHALRLFFFHRGKKVRRHPLYFVTIATSEAFKNNNGLLLKSRQQCVMGTSYGSYSLSNHALTIVQQRHY